MPLVAAKCTQCGANIEVDKDKDAGICPYCGTAFITEKAITNYNTYITNNFAGANINVVAGNIANLLELAQNALDLKNESEALKYCDKALELDIKNSDIWYVKMQAEAMRVRKAEMSIENAKSTEAITLAGNNCIKYANEDTKENTTHKVHAFYLQYVTDMLGKIAFSAQYENIEKLRALGATNGNLALIQDQNFLLGMGSQETFTLKILKEITDEELNNDEESQNALVKVINAFVDEREKYVRRLAVYGCSPNDQTVDTLTEQYNDLLNRLPSAKKSEVKRWTMEKQSVYTPSSSSYTSSNTSSSGCYVATCVYGSYDCPEVWTLRRFRDYTLDATWYGRLFIKCYYAVSPTIVKWFGETRWFKCFWKSKLDKMVRSLNSKGVANTEYRDKY